MTSLRFVARLSPALTALALLVATGCASSLTVASQLAPGASLHSYRTFAFFDAAAGGTGSLDPANRPFLEAQLRERLVARGFVFGTDAPDLVVRYTALSDDFDAHSRLGYMDDGKGWETGFGAGVDMVKPYKKGSLVIDLLDARTHKLIWRGTAEGAARPGTDARDKVKEALGQMFHDFPPG